MKNKIAILLTIISLNCSFVFGQFTDRYWTFGDSAAIDFRNLNSPVPANSILRSRGTCASICDSLGDLLFYASSPHVSLWLAPNWDNYGYILNKNHQIMDSGDSIATATWYQEMIIVPDPGNINRFYLFTAGVTTPTGFFYDQIDLTYNGGLGKVIQKNIQLQNFKVSDAIAAVKHGNGRDWWVVMKSYSNTTPVNDLYVYLVTPSGISGPFIQHIGSLDQYGGLSRLKFTKQGDKIFALSTGNMFESYDFDRCTGIFSNVNIISINNSSPPYKAYFSVAISPDASKLYTTSEYQGSNQDTSYLVQYDLNATNVLASADTLYTWIYPDLIGLLQTGPDGKIYVACAYWAADCDYDYLYCDTTRNTTTNYLSVVNSPDSLGVACDFQPFSFYLGGHRTYLGLPNNPNYELKADSGSICDTLHVGLQELFGQTSNLFVYYDTQWQTAFINAKGLKGKNYKLQLFNLNGQVVMEESGKLDSEYYTKNAILSSFADGMYVVRLSTEKEVLVIKFVKN